MRGISPFAGDALRSHGALLRVLFVVTNCRGDIGGFCVDRGNIKGFSLLPDADISDTYNMSHFTRSLMHKVVVSSVIHVTSTHYTQVPLNLSVIACHH